MNRYNREELMDIFGYSFQIFKAVDDLEAAILRVQNNASNKVMNNFEKIRSIYNKGLAVFIAFCMLLGLVQGDYNVGIIQVVFTFAIIYGIFYLLFSPILLIFNKIYKHFAKKEFLKAETNDEANSYRQKGRELLNDEQFLQYKRIVPPTYFNMNNLYLLYSYLEDFRADNFKEAANLLAEEQHRDNIEYNQRVMKESLASIQNNARYQSVLQTIQLLETRKIRTSLDVMFK